jgi:hypothetical protein
MSKKVILEYTHVFPDDGYVVVHDCIGSCSKKEVRIVRERIYTRSEAIRLVSQLTHALMISRQHLTKQLNRQLKCAGVEPVAAQRKTN